MNYLIICLLFTFISTIHGMHRMVADEEEFALRFGFDNDKKGVINAPNLKKEALSLYESDFNFFMARAKKALAAKDGEVAFKDIDLKPQKPFEVVSKYKWNENELYAIMQYTGNTRAARIMRKYWQSKNPDKKIPTLAHILHDATHKDARKADFFDPGFEAWFGFQGIDLPIMVKDSPRNVGDKLSGTILRGLWSSSTSIHVAKNEFFSPCLGDKGRHSPTQWMRETWPKKDTSVIFHVRVPANTLLKDDKLGVAPIQDLSSHSWERELLLYDIDGEYVTIFEACLNQFEDDPAVIAANNKNEQRAWWQSTLGHECIGTDFPMKCPEKVVIFHKHETNTYACALQHYGWQQYGCRCRDTKEKSERYTLTWYEDVVGPMLKNLEWYVGMTKVQIEFPSTVQGLPDNPVHFTKKADHKYEILHDQLQRAYLAVKDRDSAEQIDDNMYNVYEDAPAHAIRSKKDIYHTDRSSNYQVSAHYEPNTYSQFIATENLIMMATIVFVALCCCMTGIVVIGCLSGIYYDPKYFLNVGNHGTYE